MNGNVIHSDPDILGGTPVFVGTRVPVRTLIDYLEGGESLEMFLDHFPSVHREQAIAALELARSDAVAHQHCQQRQDDLHAVWEAIEPLPGS